MSSTPFIKSVTKYFSTGLFAIAALTANAAEPLKIGFVYVGPTGDAGWTYAHDQGRKYLEAQLGNKVKTTYVESVSEGADAMRVIRKLASSGNTLIYTTSFGYMNPTIKTAKMFPKVKFEHATGYKRAKNVGTYADRAYQGRYLTGLIAGKMTKSNLIGYVASFPIPEVVRGINAFTIGVRAVNPKANVRVIWTGSWYDPAKDREAAETLVLAGADLLTQHTDSPAVVQTAEAKGIYAFGYNSDMSGYGKKAHLTATIHNWGVIYKTQAEAILNNTWKSQGIWWGIKEGVTDLSPINPIVPKPIVDFVNTKKAEISNGQLQVFTGPIRDQQGKERIAKGQVMSDKAMLGFNWFVQGVEGQLPNS